RITPSRRILHSTSFFVFVVVARKLMSHLFVFLPKRQTLSVLSAASAMPAFPSVLNNAATNNAAIASPSVQRRLVRS
ncbi:hypothetical protein TVAG_588530, partial [Trichomonas vaginalis G3]